MSDASTAAGSTSPDIELADDDVEPSALRWPRGRLSYLMRALRIAVSLRMLAPAALGVLLTVIGWSTLAWVFGGTSDPWLQRSLPGYRSCPFDVPAARDELSEPALVGPVPWAPEVASEPIVAPPHIGTAPTFPLSSAWRQLSAPVRQLFDLDITVVGVAFVLLAALWVIGVWALVGGMLVRMAALQLTRELKITWRQALGHAASKWQSYFSAPLLPLLGILLMTIPMAIVGLLIRTNIGLFVVGLLWPLYLLAGVLMAIFLVGLLFGWPLMWAAIGTESSDSFDALSRAYSYVYQRALHYLLYAIVAGLLGVLGGLFVFGFASAIIHLAGWVVDWGGAPPTDAELNVVGTWGTNLIAFWNGVVRLVAIGFVYSYLWTAATAIYLLLRYDVDGTETDEVHVDEGQETFGMPPLATDQAGVADTVDEKLPHAAPTEAADAPSKPSSHETGLA
ncbi:MAG TPA: hypothetical protein VG713_12785 [Pirellulales bacterium]|nr:hypothetical protein [Pirellulales bacterium]